MLQGGKFLRGRKYSFPVNQKDKRNTSDGGKISAYNQLKKLNSKNSKNLMMLNISGELLPSGYDDSSGYTHAKPRMSISKTNSSGTGRSGKYPTGSKKKKSSSAQSSPHRANLKSSKQGFPNGINIGINPGPINETRPYSAKNSNYSRGKSYNSKSKRGEMKRSNSKKSPNNASKDFSGAFSQKFSHPGGIGLYGPGKLKINKDKPSTSTRGSARWNRSPNNPHGSKITKHKPVSQKSNFKNQKLALSIFHIKIPKFKLSKIHKFIFA